MLITNQGCRKNCSVYHELNLKSPLTTISKYLSAEPIQIGLKIGHLVTTRVDALEKITKNSQRLIELALRLQLIVSIPLNAVSNLLKGVGELFDLIPSIGIISFFLSPQENGVYFLFDPSQATLKKVEKLFLGSHLVCKTIRILNKWQLIDLGTICKAKVGNIPMLFSLFTDSLMCLSSIVHLMNAYQQSRVFSTRKLISNQKSPFEKYSRPIKLHEPASLPKTNLKKIESNRNQKLDNRQESYLYWLSIADAVSTLFIITIASLFTIFSLTSLVPTTILLLGGFVIDSIGFVKIYMEQL
jgi:hypothetical protein